MSNQRSLQTLWDGNHAGPFDNELINKIYSSLSSTNIKSLELNRYLENYLWIHFDGKQSSHQHLMSIVCMINEKFRENIKPWDCFREDSSKFETFFQRVLQAGEAADLLSASERVTYIQFLQNCFQSLEENLINHQVLRLISLPMWINLNEPYRNKIMQGKSRLLKQWRYFLKQDSEDHSNQPPSKKHKITETTVGESTPTKPNFYFEKYFIWKLVHQFLSVVQKISPESHGSLEPIVIEYLEKFLEFVTDLLAQLPTRRYFRSVLEASFFLPKVKLSGLTTLPEGKLFVQLLERFEYYYHFHIDDFTGAALTRDEIIERHYERIQSLQVIAYKFLSPKLRSFALRNVGSIETRSALESQLGLLSDEELLRLAKLLLLIDDSSSSFESRRIVIEAIVLQHERPASLIQKKIPVYPTEKLLWDSTKILESAQTTKRDSLVNPSIPLAKLNLQFLSVHDYLHRNFELFQMEAANDIRQDIEDAISRLGARVSDSGHTAFTGWARMGSPILQFQLGEVAKPNIGESAPASVRANVVINLAHMREDVRAEWETIKQHDILFLLSVQSPIKPGQQPDQSLEFPARYGIQALRGCEVLEVFDSRGNILGKDRSSENSSGSEPKHSNPKKKNKTGVFRGRSSQNSSSRYHARQIDLMALHAPPVDRSMEKRTFLVQLDPNQFLADQHDRKSSSFDLYSPDQFNVVIRRKAKENNFKGILDSLQTIMNEEQLMIPEWLHDVFLGYGDPASGSNLSKFNHLNFFDLFLDAEHLKESFPWSDWKINGEFEFSSPNTPLGSERIFRGKFDYSTKELQVETYTMPNAGPYPQDQPKFNSVRFTKSQLEAIFSGISTGLSVIVGPPGSGKTDVAAQIINLLYHNYPNQRTLLLTHSNQALNQLFEKLTNLHIDEAHLLRLGHGEKFLQTSNDFHFSRVGRVDFLLARRLELLGEVKRLAQSITIETDVDSSCETAAYFFQHTIRSKWNEFLRACIQDNAHDSVKIHFPFAKFFSDAPQPLFKGDNAKSDMQIAEGCFRHISKIFEELENIRPFELLRSSYDRTNYLLIKQARIIAMTCTHAALKRNELIRLGFVVDNIVMEESAQVLDLESFIPLLCRKQSSLEDHPLQRVVLIGDHHQLPPIVKNQTLRTFSKFDQSLFARLVRLGVPYVKLDQQGRSRSSLANLFNWRYENLGNLPRVSLQKEFLKANAGFRYEYQLIDVPDFAGQGESEPIPHFYQNLGEAEYVVSVFQYMRLLGYPAEKISIITSYNGQKYLIRDVVKNRCASNPFFGQPHKITTVDRYQGQQNDYILFSMVRTQSVGHIRDVRRLIVAVSRARLGLYVFCRKSLFENCFELAPAFSQFLTRPTTLQLIPNEHYPTERDLLNDVPSKTIGDYPQMLEVLSMKSWELQARQQ